MDQSIPSIAECMDLLNEMLPSYADQVLMDTINAEYYKLYTPTTASKFVQIPVTLVSPADASTGTQTAKQYFGTRLSTANNVIVNAAATVIFVGYAYGQATVAAVTQFRYINAAAAAFNSSFSNVITVGGSQPPNAIFTQIVGQAVTSPRAFYGRLIILTV